MEGLWDSIEWIEELDSSGVRWGECEYQVGDGLIRMNMRDIRNEEVWRDISDWVELFSSEGHVRERDLNMREVVPGPRRGKHPPNISDFSLPLSLAPIQTHKQTLTHTPAQTHPHTYTLTHRHTHTHTHTHTRTNRHSHPHTNAPAHRHSHTHTHQIHPYRPTLPGRHPPIQTHSPTPLDLILEGEDIADRLGVRIIVLSRRVRVISITCGAEEIREGW